jgi:hypothetical protein
MSTENQKKTAKPVAETAATEAKKPGKGHATPSRKQAEAQNVRPLVAGASASKDPVAKAAAREQLRANRTKAREGMLAGDDRFLGPRDRGPQKRMARDYVDSRFTVGEAMIPTMVLVLLLSAFNSITIEAILVLLMWILLLGIVIDGWFISRKVNRMAAEKFGAGKVEKGLGWYAAIRATQLRWMRIPKPAKK